MALTVIVRGLPKAGKNSLAIDLTKRIRRKYQGRITFKLLNTERLRRVFNTPQERLNYITDILMWTNMAHISLFVVLEATDVDTVDAIVYESERSVIIKVVDDVTEPTPENVTLLEETWEDHPDEITVYRSTLDMEATMEKIMKLYN